MGILDALSGISAATRGAVNSVVQDPTNLPTLPPPNITFSPTQATGAVNSVVQAPPDSQPTLGRPSLWRTILSGALTGLANSGGATDVAGGFTAGLQGEKAQTQQSLINQQRQQQLDTQQQTAQAEQAMYHAQTAGALLKLAQANSSSPEHADMLRDYSASQTDGMVRAGGAKMLAGGFSDIDEAQQAALANGGRVSAYHDDDGKTIFGTFQFSTDKITTPSTVNYVAADGTTKQMQIGANTISYADLDELNHKFVLNSVDANYKQHLANIGVQQKVDVADQTGVTARNEAAAAKSTAQAAAPKTPVAKVDNLLVGTMPDGSQVGGTAAELGAAGVTGITKMPALQQSQALVARQLIAPNGLFGLIKTDIDALDQRGKLGPIAGNWSDFLAGKGVDADFAPLRNHLKLLSTALMQAHMGNRGGKDIMQHFTDMVPVGSTPANIRAALGSEYSYVHEKAMLIPHKKAGQ